MHHDSMLTSFTDAKTTQDGVEAALAAVDVSAPPGAAEERKELTKLSVLKDIVLGQFVRIQREQVKLKKMGAIMYDSAIVAPTVDDPNKLKVLVYCSADETIKVIEDSMPIHSAHLTGSSMATFKKLREFCEAPTAQAIIANSWRDAAGIDFKTATDVVIINYVDMASVVQQMVARLLRMGRTTRPRIWLLAYNNEKDMWMRTHCEAVPLATS
jgi:hypothetical protein